MNRYHDSCRNSTTRNMTLSDIVERGAQAMSLFFWRQRQTNIELLKIQHTCEENWLVLKRSIIRRTSTNWVVDQVSFATGVPLNNDLDELWNQTRSQWLGMEDVGLPLCPDPRWHGPGTRVFAPHNSLQLQDVPTTTASLWTIEYCVPKLVARAVATDHVSIAKSQC